MFTLTARRILFAFSISISSLASAQYGVPPKAWYLVVDKGLSDFVYGYTQKLNKAISLPTGLYYTNQRDAQLRYDLRGGLQRSVENLPQNMEGEMGYASDGKNKGKNEDKEFWLLKKSGEKFLLATFDSATKKWIPNTIGETPVSFYPFRDGVIALDSQTKLKCYHNRSRQNPSGKEWVSGLPVFTRNFGKGEAPIMTHNVRAAKLLVATSDKPTLESEKSFIINPEKDGEEGVESAKAEEVRGDVHPTVDLYLIDLMKDTKELVLKDLKWPFFLNSTGLYRKTSDDTAITFEAFDWSETDLKKAFSKPQEVTDFDPNFDEMEVLESQFFYTTKSPTTGKKTKHVVTPDGRKIRYLGNSNPFTALGKLLKKSLQDYPHEDILEKLRLGELIPLYMLKETNNFLATSLGATENTMALLTYDEGQRPEDLIASFVWGMDTGELSVSPFLKEVENVYLFEGDRLFDVKDESEVKSRIESLREIAQGHRVILFLHDFPTRIKEDVEKGEASSRFQLFTKDFRDCVKEGTCRVVLTMRKDVYQQLRSGLAGYFEEGKIQVSEVPTLPEKLADGTNPREQIARISRNAWEQRYGKKITDTAFDQFLRYSGDVGRTIKSPGNEQALLEKLITFLKTDSDLKAVTDINESIFTAFTDRVRGLDVTRERLDLEGLRKYLKEWTVGKKHHEVIDSLVDNELIRIKTGIKSKRGTLAQFTMTGPPGVGKTHIAKLISEYLTGDKNPLRIEMKTFGGFKKGNRVALALENSKDRVKVVIFDDFHMASRDVQDSLAGVLGEGIYGQNTDDEIDFSNIIVVLTANWGHTVINSNDTTNVNSLRSKIRMDLTGDKTGNGAQMSEWLWSRIEPNLYWLPRLSQEENVDVVKMMVKRHAKALKQTNNGIDLVVHPAVLGWIIKSEESAQAGARSVEGRLESQVFSSYSKKIALPGVKQLLLVQDGESTVALTNLDGAAFTDGMKEAEEQYKKGNTFIVNEYISPPVSKKSPGQK